MHKDPIDDLIELEREYHRERAQSAIWEDVVRGLRAPHDAPGSDHERELFRPLDAATRTRLVNLVHTTAPAEPPAQRQVTQLYPRRWWRVTGGIGALAAAAGFVVHLSSTAPNDDSLPTLALASPPEVSLLGGHASARLMLSAFAFRQRAAEVYEVDEHHEFRIEVRSPGETLVVRRLLARCSGRDLELRFSAPITTPGLTIAKVVPALAPGEVCNVEVHFEFGGRLLRLPDALTPRIRITKAR